MSTITTINSTDQVSASRSVINTNFSNLNTDKVEGQAASVDSEMALFSGTGGKTIKRASSSGIVKLTSGVVSVVTAPSGTIVGDTDTQTLTNKTIGTTNIISFNAPQGFPINGKISVTDSGSGLVVALKTLAGTDPSATDPVYVRIGDTVRTISAALSVTKADGTNWMNAGSSELATKEVDYFVYLGYNATDGVVIGFSRFPGATQYGDFSATTTNEKYCAISTITNAASTDYYEVIGRFAATLSAGAGYTWSVPTYTAANLIQRPIYETRWLSYVGTITAGAGTPTTVTHTAERYKITSDMIDIHSDLTVTDKGTASSTFVSTMPFSHKNSNLVTFGGREVNITGKLLGISISGATSTFNVFGTLNDTMWVNNYRLPVVMRYEI